MAFIFQQITQKIQIYLLCFLLPLEFPEYAIPLIYNNHKWSFRSAVNILHRSGQIRFIKIPKIRIFLKEIPQKTFSKQFQHSLYSAALAEKFLHVKENRIVLIQILSKRLTFFYLKPGK